MPFCPNCKDEYREGYTVCAECGETLVEQLEEPREELQNEPPDARPERAMDEVFLTSVADRVQREMLVEILAGAGIPASAYGNEAGDYMEVYMGYSVYGERIFVDRADYDRAVEVMRGADAGGGETLADVPEWEDAAGDEPYGKDEQRERRVKAWILVLFITGGLAAAVMGIVFMFFF